MIAFSLLSQNSGQASLESLVSAPLPDGINSQVGRVQISPDLRRGLAELARETDFDDSEHGFCLSLGPSGRLAPEPMAHGNGVTVVLFCDKPEHVMSAHSHPSDSIPIPSVPDFVGHHHPDNPAKSFIVTSLSGQASLVVSTAQSRQHNPTDTMYNGISFAVENLGDGDIRDDPDPGRLLLSLSCDVTNIDCYFRRTADEDFEAVPRWPQMAQIVLDQMSSSGLNRASVALQSTRAWFGMNGKSEVITSIVERPASALVGDVRYVASLSLYQMSDLRPMTAVNFSPGFAVSFRNGVGIDGDSAGPAGFKTIEIVRRPKSAAPGLTDLCIRHGQDVRGDIEFDRNIRYIDSSSASFSIVCWDLETASITARLLMVEEDDITSLNGQIAGIPISEVRYRSNLSCRINFRQDFEDDGVCSIPLGDLLLP